MKMTSGLSSLSSKLRSVALEQLDDVRDNALEQLDVRDKLEELDDVRDKGVPLFVGVLGDA